MKKIIYLLSTVLILCSCSQVSYFYPTKDYKLVNGKDNVEPYIIELSGGYASNVDDPVMNYKNTAIGTVIAQKNSADFYTKILDAAKSNKADTVVINALGMKNGYTTYEVTYFVKESKPGAKLGMLLIDKKSYKKIAETNTGYAAFPTEDSLSYLYDFLINAIGEYGMTKYNIPKPTSYLSNYDYNQISDNAPLVVRSVFKNSPAYIAGLKRGDIILSINGNNVTWTDFKYQPQEKNTIKILRDHKEYVIVVDTNYEDRFRFDPDNDYFALREKNLANLEKNYTATQLEETKAYEITEIDFSKFKKLISSIDIKKGQFEKTSEFNARQEKFLQEFKKENPYFKINIENTKVTYDADKEMWAIEYSSVGHKSNLLRNLSKGSTGELRLLFANYKDESQQTIGENAFGAKSDMIISNKTGEGVYFESDKYITFEDKIYVKMPLDEAKKYAGKKPFRVTLVFSLSDQNVFDKYIFHVPAKRDSFRVELNDDYSVIEVEPVAILVEDQSGKKIHTLKF